jgi:carboxyl-terminal processing protease
VVSQAPFAEAALSPILSPILSPNTKLAVLINKGTASAAEIVSGAVQDLDAGVIVGSDRTFGKGLVQNVEELPFNTALKFTVAKHCTPSGRCIQSQNYKEGGGRKEDKKT